MRRRRRSTQVGGHNGDVGTGAELLLRPAPETLGPVEGPAPGPPGHVAPPQHTVLANNVGRQPIGQHHLEASAAGGGGNASAAGREVVHRRCPGSLGSC